MSPQLPAPILMGILLLAAVASSGCVSSGPAEETTPAAVGAVSNDTVLTPPKQAGSNISSATPAAARAAISVPDPSRAGPREVASGPYDFGRLIVQYPTLMAPYVVPVRGSVHYPADSAEPSPLIVVMHGRHGTCYGSFVGIGVMGECPETPVSSPVESFRGYDYLAENLASHGYVVVGIDANSVNENDLWDDLGASQRADLILTTIDRFAGEAPGPMNPDPAGSGSPVPPSAIDVTRIGLMGHSRGGEGVAAAVARNLERDSPLAIRAVFALAPTDFVRHMLPDVAFATLLPYCDGDVMNLQGAFMFDDNRYPKIGDTEPRYQILAIGANHNYYNTVWEGDGDDASWSTDPYCGGRKDAGAGRLSGDDQRRHGLVYMASFLRAHVGGEDGFLPILSGAYAPPESGCPVEASTECGDLIHVSRHMPAGARRVVASTEREAATATNDLGGKVSGTGFTKVTACATTYENYAGQGFPGGFVATRAAPSLPKCKTAESTAAAGVLHLQWRDAARLDFGIPAASGNVAAFDSVTLRIGVDFGEDPTPVATPPVLSIRLTDAGGQSATVPVDAHANAVFHPPGDDFRRVTLNMAGIPLSAFGGVDLTRVATLSIVLAPTAGPGILVTDVMFQ